MAMLLGMKFWFSHLGFGSLSMHNLDVCMNVALCSKLVCVAA
jgi:hypothetical protein